MKRFISITLCLVMVMSTLLYNIPVQAASTNSTSTVEKITDNEEIEAILEQANYEIKMTYNIFDWEFGDKNGYDKKLQPIVTRFGTLLVYGDETNAPFKNGSERMTWGNGANIQNDYDSKTKQWRYFGQTIGGDLFTNLDFPPDSSDPWTYVGIALGEEKGKEWVSEPWKNSKKRLEKNNKITTPLSEAFDTMFYINNGHETKQKINEQIKLGMILSTPERVFGQSYKGVHYEDLTDEEIADKMEELTEVEEMWRENNSEYTMWADYVHIIQPPTYSFRGVGVMYRYWTQGGATVPWYNIVLIK